MTNVYGWESQANAYRQEAIDKENEYKTQMQNIENDPQVKELKSQLEERKKIWNLSYSNYEEYVNKLFEHVYGVNAKTAWDTINNLPDDGQDMYYPDRHNWYSPLKAWETSAPKLFALLNPLVRDMGFGNWQIPRGLIMQKINATKWNMGYKDWDLQGEIKDLEAKLEQLTGQKQSTVNTTYGTAQENASTAYNNLKFSREDAMKAISSGRLQERLVNSPYKIL